HFAAREPAGFLQDGIHQIRRQITEGAGPNGFGQSGDVVESEGDLFDRSLVHALDPPHRQQQAVGGLAKLQAFYVNVNPVVNRRAEDDRVSKQKARPADAGRAFLNALADQPISSTANSRSGAARYRAGTSWNRRQTSDSAHGTNRNGGG